MHPDYTRTCSCSYQNQTSLALVHMPDIEVWAVDSSEHACNSRETNRAHRGQLGAPGDRRGTDGQLWMEYPPVAGDSATVTIRVNSNAKYFQHHSSLITDSDLPWVLSSASTISTELDINLRVEKPYSLKTGLPVEHIEDDAEEDASAKLT